jgi:hypothetical protein
MDMFVRTIGIARAKTNIAMTTLPTTSPDMSGVQLVKIVGVAQALSIAAL